MNIIMKSVFVVVAGGVLSSCACHARRMTSEEPRARLSQEHSEASPETIGMNNVYFAFDSCDLSESSKNILQKNADWLRTNDEVSVRIDGRADERGTNSYNMALAKNRALAAGSYLSSQGIAAERISTVSYGEERTLDPRHNEAAWATNRQAEFKALGSESRPFMKQ